MALVANSLDSKLQIQVHLGVNEDGKDITRTKTFSRIKSETSDQDLFDVAQSLVDLQEHPLMAIRKIASTEFEDE